MSLRGKKIVLGITAGIAAYKTTYLVRLFIKAGAQVRVVMTPEAKQFVTPLSLSTLSKNEVITHFTEAEEEVWNNHVELGLWADYMVIAPVTANTLSKMAHGHSDNMLLATYLSAKCPVYLAPAMDLDMYKHPSTQKNLQQLQSFGNKIVPVGKGELASGLEGEGRMAEPEEILQFLEDDILAQLPLYGKTVLITAGPTYEAIDPVRFIGNHSSGKMGFALAEAASKKGARVILVSGPTALQVKEPNIELIRVQSADEMYQAVHEHFANVDIGIAAAAVSDYKPAAVANQKIKKNDDHMQLSLVKNKDILKSMGAIKKQQFLVGFALETENELVNATAKLEKKNLDMIVLNSLNDSGAGFQHDTNKVSLITPTSVNELALAPKTEIASQIIDQIIAQVL